jgi:uncharacterized membrane-anchored protein YhcB (DUF1043 family)
MMDDYKRDCVHFEKQQASLWVDRLKQVMQSVYNAMTPSSRELFNRELEGNDIFVYPSIAEKLMRLSPEQRELVEQKCDELMRDVEVKNDNQSQ